MRFKEFGQLQEVKGPIFHSLKVERRKERMKFLNFEFFNSIFILALNESLQLVILHV